MGESHLRSTRNIKTAFFLNLAFTVVEIIGGYWVNSVAILSDAVHDLGDSLSLGIAWFLQHQSNRQPTTKFSFGYARFSLLGALINGLILIAGSIYIVQQAIGRIIVHEPVNAEGMFGLAILGIAVNSYAAWKLSKGNTQNEKVVSWHLLEDVLGWAMILIASIVLYFKDVPYLDPILSIFITLFILWNVAKRLKETLTLFLQGTPKEIDLLEIDQRITAIKGVHSAHHLHVWSLEGEQHVVTIHVKILPVENVSDIERIKSEVKKVLRTYKFHHCTIEIEFHDEDCGLN